MASRYYILHGPLAGVGVYDSLAKAQSALEIRNIQDKDAWIESLPANTLISSLAVKRECYSFDGAWVSFDEPIECEYTITSDEAIKLFADPIDA